MILSGEEIRITLEKVLLDVGFDQDLASLNARIFTDSTLDGYHSHGINRFSEFVRNVKKGIIDPRAKPVLKESLTTIERYDGLRGAGPSNAHFCMAKAIELSKKHGLASTALSNTNHWMRGGSYGWQAAGEGCAAICFTNTMPNMPPWGGITNTTGNNPLIMAVPRKEGDIVLDMSMSQFSYGKIYEYRLKGKKLPLSGGFDEAGNMTDDPEAIIQSRRILQTGYWKGSGLSMMLDLLATLLSGGNSTAQISNYSSETALSQVFLCIDVKRLGPESEMLTKINEVVDYFTSSKTQQADSPVRYPGEATLQRRQEQLKNGIIVSDEIWQTIVHL